MTKKNRDEFAQRTILQIAKRVGWLCSFPSCRTPTVGATEDGKGEINIGTAAHICAAAPGGPRYDGDMSDDERSSADNGIWMCRDHGKAIDSDVNHFTASMLREWKRQAELDSWRRVLRNEATGAAFTIADADLTKRLRTAAEQDLGVFKRTAKWPPTSVALRLEVEGFDMPVATDALARAVTSFEDLILVAGPGMGKTTTVFQIAEGILGTETGVPLIVLLSDWATTEDVDLLQSILKRPAFRDMSEEDFRRTAEQPGIVLLLDGWNELNDNARNRARVQIEKLKAELRYLGLVVSARRPRYQALDIPFSGKRIDLMPLSDEQQKQIASAMRGEVGVALVDQAWRVAGIRELVTIPLYLTALLSLPKGAPFPTTKEEVLRHFVAALEAEPSRAETLQRVVQGFQQDYLNGLAVLATQSANTAIADTNARRSISATVKILADNGQIRTGPEPNVVLDALIGCHVLMRAGDSPGISFQHQQFQEWYASHYVECRIIAEVSDPRSREVLKAEVFNLPIWEESILFAVERLSRGCIHDRVACSKAISAAFEVDPILAAEMIFRSSDEVWKQIAGPILARVKCWHTTGRNNRALRFMLMSGRAEFFDDVWPLITDENSQISLSAIRNCKRFRPSVLGKDAARKIKDLSQDRRITLLSEIASNSGMDGLDLVAHIVKDDPEPKVKASVVEALAFRQANRHVVRTLSNSDEKVFDLIARRDLIDEIDDEEVRKKIETARKRLAAEKTSFEDRLRLIADSETSEDRAVELTGIVSTMEMSSAQSLGVEYVYKARDRYPRAVADGLLARVRAGRELLHGSDNVLATAGLIIEDEELLKLALTDPASYDDRSDAAASVLGPIAVGRMIDALFIVAPSIGTDLSAARAFNGLKIRLSHVPGASLVAAVVSRSSELNSEQMARLAIILSRDSNAGSDRSRPFDAEAIATIRGLVRDWGRRMLVSNGTQRWEKAAIATLASHVPDVSLLKLLKKMHDDNLRRLRRFRAEAEAGGWQDGVAKREVQHPYTYDYQRAFLAIKAPETAALMHEYLEDEDFGSLAARVLMSHWYTANEPPKKKRSFGRVDWSDVEKRQITRALNPAATCDEAEAIFAAIDRLIADGTTPKQNRLAVSLAIAALRLPHGQREDTVRKLISLAPINVYDASRRELLLSLVLSGKKIDIADVAAGISATLEAAKKNHSILMEDDGHYLTAWLQLLPFVDKSLDALPVLLDLPVAQRDPYFLRDVVSTYAYAPSKDAEEILYKLAETDPRFYTLHEWRDSVMALGTAPAARRMIDLVASGAFGRKPSSEDRFFVRQLGETLSEYPELRHHIYSLLKDGATTQGLALVAEAIVENPDEEGLLVLVKCERANLAFNAGLAIGKAVTEHVPVEGYQNTYNVIPAAAGELRRKLLAMTTDGGASDVAARWLNTIDEIRDLYGLPEGEPRHPDLGSGKPWPIIPSKLDTESSG